MIISTEMNYFEHIKIDKIVFMLHDVQKMSDILTCVNYKIATTEPFIKNKDIIEFLNSNSKIYNLLELIIGQVITDKLVSVGVINDQEWMILTLFTMSPSDFISDVLLDSDDKKFNIYTFKNKIGLPDLLYDINIQIDKYDGYICRFFDTYISTIDISIDRNKILDMDGLLLTNIYDYIIQPNVILDSILSSPFYDVSLSFLNHMVARKCDDTLQLVCITIPDSISGVNLVDMSENYIAGYVTGKYDVAKQGDPIFNIIPYFHNNPTTLYYVERINRVIVDGGQNQPYDRHSFEIFFDTKILKLDNDKEFAKHIFNPECILYYNLLFCMDGHFCIYQSIDENVNERYCGYYYNGGLSKGELQKYIHSNLPVMDYNMIEFFQNEKMTYFILKK